MAVRRRSYRKPTIREVADLAGVSVTTVSHVVSGVRSYAPDTVKKVQDAIAALKYTPSYIAQGLRQKATMTLGVCGFDPLRITNPTRRRFAEELWRGVALEADERDYSLLYYSSRIRTGEVIDPFLNGFIDGLLMIQLPTDPRPAEIASTGMPVVIQMRGRELPPGVGCAYVDEDHAADLALTTLWDMGHRRIAYFGGPTTDDLDIPRAEPSDPIACWRADAYRDWMVSRDAYSERLQASAYDWEPEDVSATLTRWFTSQPRPTAVFCANDAIALKVIEGAHSVGLRVPHDLSVVGVDDVPAAATSSPTLTTLPIPVLEIGRESVRCLIRIIEGSDPDSCRTTVKVPSLVMRESIAPPPTYEPSIS